MSGSSLAMSEATLYETLRVHETASAEEIKSAFRRRAKQTHPDYGGTADEFRAVQSASEVLSDPDRRKEYDAMLATERTTRMPSGKGIKPAVKPPTAHGRPAPRPRRRTRKKSSAYEALDLVGAILWLAAYGSGFFAGLGVVGGAADGQAPSDILEWLVLGGPTVGSLVLYGLGLAGLSYLANHYVGNHSSVIREETAFGSLLYVVGAWGFWISIVGAFTEPNGPDWTRALAVSALFGLSGFLLDTAQFVVRREWRAATDYYTRPAASSRLQIGDPRTGPNATRIIRRFLRRWARRRESQS